MTLTDLDRRAITKARQLADAYGTDAIREVTGSTATDYALVIGEAFGAAQAYLTILADLAERLDG